MPASALLLAARVASLNLCTDEYLLLLAHPDEVASISYLSQDPLESPLWRLGRRYPHNYGSFEQVLKARPDVLLTMGSGGRASGLLAGRMGVRTVELSFVTKPADVAVNLSRVATALGDSKRALPWIRRLEALQASQPANARDAIFLSGGGQSFSSGGAGEAWLRLAGLSQRPLAGSRASLETLLVKPPQILVQSNYRRRQVSTDMIWLNHPIVRGLKARRITSDGRVWTCMGPTVIPEVERLRKLAR
jgi:iron complex transport system substrate-binding protein